MKYFDCNCSYGNAARPPHRYAKTPAELVNEMDFCGIDEALCFHTNQRFAAPQLWNEVATKDLKKFTKRLHLTWSILPTACGEIPAPKDLFKVMKKNGVKALRAFPQEHRFRLDLASFPDLFPLMAVRKIPLFAKENLFMLKELLKECPELKVVAMNQGPHGLDRYLWPLMDAFPNLYVETSGFLVDGLIETSCQRYGHGRILFGSGFPDNANGGSLLRLAQADIEEKARAAIAGGNLQRMLDEVAL